MTDDAIRLDGKTIAYVNWVDVDRVVFVFTDGTHWELRAAYNHEDRCSLQSVQSIWLSRGLAVNP